MNNKVRGQKTQTKMILSLALLTMSVTFAMVISTVAWFTMQQKTDSSLDQITAISREIYGTNMKAYSVTDIEENSYTFVNHENYELPRFDPSNIDYNQYEKALVLRIAFSSSAAGLYKVRVTCSEDFHDNETIQSESYDHLSNCIEFRAGTVVEDIDPATFESSTITTTTQTSFVELSGGLVSKNSWSIDVIEINAVVGLNVAYVVLQYNLPVIEYINDLRNNNPTLLRYLNDISFKIVGGSNA